MVKIIKVAAAMFNSETFRQKLQLPTTKVLAWVLLRNATVIPIVVDTSLTKQQVCSEVKALFVKLVSHNVKTSIQDDPTDEVLTTFKPPEGDDDDQVTVLVTKFHPLLTETSVQAKDQQAFPPIVLVEVPRVHPITKTPVDWRHSDLIIGNHSRHAILSDLEHFQPIVIGFNRSTSKEMLFVKLE
jgi:hypothetical protein